MVAYNFQARFAPAIEAGTKRQTIRLPRKDTRHARLGEAVQLYTGMRTKACRLLREAVCCECRRVMIHHNNVWTYQPVTLIAGGDLEAFARRDGFTSWPDMRDWFEAAHGLPFDGFLIGWN